MRMAKSPPSTSRRKYAARQLKSEREIQLMRWSGLIVWQAHQIAARLIRPGATTAEVNQAVHDYFRELDVEPLFFAQKSRNRFVAPT